MDLNEFEFAFRKIAAKEKARLKLDVFSQHPNYGNWTAALNGLGYSGLVERGRSLGASRDIIISGKASAEHVFAVYSLLFG
jgi:hypothetical protein